MENWELGLSQEAIIYFTKAPPTSATWLTKEAAERLGIQVKDDLKDLTSAQRLPYAVGVTLRSCSNNGEP
jgi:hypothetical protein